MDDFIHIDGSLGEGGGQVIRSSLALSMLTGRPIMIDNIRENRKPPGLKRQHLTAVQAAARVSNALLSAVDVGSRSLTFEPSVVQPGRYQFSVGTAGSATLVLQTILPPLLVADCPSTIILEGGTHNAWAPPFDFFAKSYLPLVNRMGPNVTAVLERHGFFPTGGGRFRVDVTPSPRLAGFHLRERGEIRSRQVRALTAQLPEHVGQREVDTALRHLDWRRTEGRSEQVHSLGPGNVLMAEVESAAVHEVFTGFGRRGLRAEHVAKSLADEVGDYLAADVPVGPYLADQLLLPLGISAWQRSHPVAGGSFRTVPLTQHSLTHIEILRTFLEIDVSVVSTDATRTVCVKPSPERSDAEMS